jgi:hypothetical protein
MIHLIVMPTATNDVLTVTTIQLEDTTRDRLKTYGIKSESYDTIVIRLMDYFDTADEKLKTDLARRFLGGKKK